MPPPAPHHKQRRHQPQVTREVRLMTGEGRTIPLSGHEPPVHAEMLELLLRMGRAARSEVVQARAAFSGRNMAMAEDLVRQDREINRLNREIFQYAIEIGDDPDTREWAMHMTMVARALERVGDNDDLRHGWGLRPAGRRPRRDRPGNGSATAKRFRLDEPPTAKARK